MVLHFDTPICFFLYSHDLGLKKVSFEEPSLQGQPSALGQGSQSAQSTVAPPLRL